MTDKNQQEINNDNIRYVMISPENLRKQGPNSEEIDLRELTYAIWNGKWVIILTTLVFAVASVIYATSLPNIYKSEALLAPVSEDGGLKIPGQLGGLAALAGVNLGGMANGDKSGLAIEIIKSREFLGRFIENNDLFIPVMAAKGWRRSENKLEIDEDIYDVNSGEWVRKVSPPFQPKPSLMEVYDEFLKLFAISLDKTSNMVKMSVEHYSPYLAQQWVNKLVAAINEEMRNRELSEAQRSIIYLNSQIEQTNIADVRAMLYSLIEEQTKTVMLANVRDEYVFKTVDPAVVAEKKAKPKRALLCIIGMLFGLLLSVFVTLVKYFNSKS